VVAAQLATVLLVVVLGLLQLEQRAERRMRFAQGRVSRQGTAESQPVRLRGGAQLLAWLACGVPVLLGFALPVLILLRALAGSEMAVPWLRFADWAGNSLRLGGITALLAVGVALLLAFAVRQRANLWNRGVVQLVGIGYAIPGAVVVVGLLLPVVWMQQAWPQSSAGAWITATSLGLIWAYLVRFCAVALQSVQSGYARIPISLDDSSRMLGVTGWGLLRQVHAPLLKRTTLAALLLVFVDVMKELPATMVLRPFNSDTLAVVAYQLARDERLGEAALPSLALVLVGLIPVVLLSRTLGRQQA
jgi:iron(III) transport system permease protein